MPTITTEELLGAVKPKRTITTEELFAQKPITPFSEISAPRTPFQAKPSIPSDIAQAQNVAAILRVSGMPLTQVRKEYEGKTPETGLRMTYPIGIHREPTRFQVIQRAADIPIKATIAAGLLTTPVPMLAGLGIGYPVFKGLDWLTQKGVEALPQKTPEGIKEAAQVAGLAGSLYAGGKILGGISSKLKKTPTKYAAEATAEVRAMLRPTQGEIKNIEIRKGKNIDDYFNLGVEEQLPIKQSIDKRSGRSALDTLDAREVLKPKQEQIHERLKINLRSRPYKQFDLLEIGRKAKTELRKQIKNDTEYKNAVNDVDEYIADAIETRGRKLNGEELNDFKQGMWSVSFNLLKPTTQNNARKLGFIAKEAIENAYPEANIKSLNELSGAYATLDNLLQNAHGRVVQGGLMGRYFARTIGAIAGGKIPIAGPIAGQYAGGKMADYIASPERISKIVAKKAQKAGIVGKTFQDVMAQKLPVYRKYPTAPLRLPYEPEDLPRRIFPLPPEAEQPIRLRGELQRRLTYEPLLPAPKELLMLPAPEGKPQPKPRTIIYMRPEIQTPPLTGMSGKYREIINQLAFLFIKKRKR